MPSTTVMLNKGSIVSAKGTQRPDIYLINVENNTEELFNSLLDSTLWNPKAKFIISNADISTNFLNILNRYFVTRVAVVTHGGSELSAQIFDYEIVGENTPKSIEIGTCDGQNLFVFNEFFTERNKNRSFNMLQIFVSEMPPFIINNSPGINSAIIEAISTHLGISTNYTVMDLFRMDRDITIFSTLRTRNFDMFGGIVSPKSYEFFYFDLSHPVLEDRCAFALPLLNSSRQSNALIGEFTICVWFFYVMTIIIFMSLLYVYDIFFYSQTIKKRYPAYMMTTEICFLNCTAHKAKGTLRRFIFITFLLFTIIISTAYKSKLFAKLTETETMPRLRTFEDVMDLNMSIAVEQQVQIEKLADFNYGQYIQSHAFHCECLEACLNRTADRQDIVTLGSFTQLEWFISLEHRNQLHILPNFFLEWHSLSFFFVKGHPILEKFNKILMMFKEFGFIKKL